MNLKCIIIDDEPIARQIISQYCAKLQIEVVATCADAFQAKQILERQNVDVVFLDINMPVLDGIEFVKTLRTNAQVIFTTAYKEFAHEAFDLNACDYLLKPFSIGRFMQAIDKARERRSKTSKPDDAATEDFIYIKTNSKIIKVPFDDLQYAEANGNNVKIVMQDVELLPAMTFSSFEQLLPKSKFIRVHRSFIVNRSVIKVIEGNRIMIGSREIPIGANYRASLLGEIGLRQP